MAHWYITLAGIELGPLADDQLRHLANQGRLRPDDPVRKLGMTHAIRAGRVRGLFNLRLDYVNPPTPRSLMTFSNWYKLHPGRWPAWAQVIAWVFYGFLWLPGWWAVDLLGAEDEEVQRFGRRVLEVVGCSALIVLAAIVLEQKHRDRVEPQNGCRPAGVTASAKHEHIGAWADFLTRRR